MGLIFSCLLPSDHALSHTAMCEVEKAHDLRKGHGNHCSTRGQVTEFTSTSSVHNAQVDRLWREEPIVLRRLHTLGENLEAAREARAQVSLFGPFSEVGFIFRSAQPQHHRARSSLLVRNYGCATHLTSWFPHTRSIRASDGSCWE